MLTQLPDNAIAAGYKMTRPYQWEQVFKTPGFEGTEQEFIKAGLAYGYVNIGRGMRRVIAGVK